MPVSDLAELDYRSCHHTLARPSSQINQVTGPQPSPLKCTGVLSYMFYILYYTWSRLFGSWELAQQHTLSFLPGLIPSICSPSRSADKGPTGSRVLGLLGQYKSNISPFLGLSE